MTVLSRGGRNRRGGRRPGWLLLTTLLVLAIVASSALVFTNRVELLKLAVVLSLWAAVVAAFVSVIYRRQSDVDAARARDLKLVYDLQLDREISARREYELSVESHLRRELAAELRAQGADEVAALRAELAALRANLEILFDADLGDRPALEGDRAAGYGDWTRDTATMPPTPGRVQSSRITPVSAEDSASRTAENPIIDVPEEPLVPPPPAPAPPPQQQPYAPPPPRRRYQEPPPPEDYDAYRGSHRRPSAVPEQPPVAPPPRQSEPIPAPVAQPQPEPRPQPAPEPIPVAQNSEWQPVEAEGRWLPPGAPGSSWVSPTVESAPAPDEPRRGRHWTGTQQEEPEPAPPRPVMQPAPEPAAPRARHSVEAPSYGPAAPAMSAPPPPPQSGGRRRKPEPEPEPQLEAGPEQADGPRGQHTGGQSVAELLARLESNGNGGGKRRRRED